MNMSEPIRTSGTYHDGVIRLDQPCPGLAGMFLDIEISFPGGRSQAAQVKVNASAPGPQVVIGNNLAGIGHGENAPLVRHIRQFRKRLLQASGFRLPSVRIIVDNELPGNSYAIILRERCVGRGTLILGRLLVVVPDAGERKKLKGLSRDIQPDPIFGLPSCWVGRGMERVARKMGLTVARPEQVLAGHVEEVLTNHLGDCLQMQDVYGIIDSAAKTRPDLVADVIPARLSEVELHALLASLLSAGRRISPIGDVLEAICLYTGHDKNELTGFVCDRMPRFGVV